MDQIIAVVASRKVEADGIISLELSAAGGEPLPAFEAGAHIDVNVAGVVRQYSLCCEPGVSDRYRLGVLLEEQSRGGSAGVHGLAIGEQLVISAPRNNFQLDETARHSVLLAGGIGITPLLAMASRLHAIGASFELHYCARTPGRAAFLYELATAAFSDRISTHFDDGDEAQRFAIARDLPSPGPGRHLYVCGPAGFMDFVTGGASAAGWPAESVHLEYFNAEVDVSGGPFVVEARHSGLTVTVDAGQTIAEVLLEHGIFVPVSCEQGVCGTCLTPVIEGIPDHRDLFQTDEEKAANTDITICCSRSKSATLVLDL